MNAKQEVYKHQQNDFHHWRKNQVCGIFWSDQERSDCEKEIQEDV